MGETEEVLITTRWKDRDGSLTVVEASHLSRTERVALGIEEADPADAEAESEPEASAVRTEGSLSGPLATIRDLVLASR